MEIGREYGVVSMKLVLSTMKCQILGNSQIVMSRYIQSR